MKNLARALIGCFVTDYRVNFIYACDGSASQMLPDDEAIVPTDDRLRALLETSETAKLRNGLLYDRKGLRGFVLTRVGEPLCWAHFATPAQYDRENTWPLLRNEVALMDIVTEERARGQGLAPRMIRAASAHFMEGQAQRLIAFIWWSNTPSVRAFTKAGWSRIGLSIEWQTARTWRHLHVPLATTAPRIADDQAIL